MISKLNRRADTGESSQSSSSGARRDSSGAWRLPRFNTRGLVSTNQEQGKGPLGLNTLHQPVSNNAVADIVFVHGLAGGSRSTWTASNDATKYWPREWLPHDEDFRDARIHSFGYNSNWDKESILGIHDFANVLLASILDSPAMSPNDRTPIIFVAHSMGGLVIKRAFILSKTKPEYQSLSSRIQTMFFLATPHHGADLAETLSRLLAYGSGGARPFVDDLRRQSSMISSLNDDFPRYSQDLQLYSFFETLPMDIGFKKSLIVDRHSAVLGYANERVQYLHANHRWVCKYESEEDPNYLTVRNALARVLEDLRTRAISRQSVTSKDDRRRINSFLSLPRDPEDDFSTADDQRMDGSCEWLIHRDDFQKWCRDSRSSVYSIAAKPGTGKTILSAKVISYLRQVGAKCSFHFFRHQDKTTSDIAPFLLSIARQMALQDEKMLAGCLEVIEKEETLNRSNFQTIWRKLYLEKILPSNTNDIHYWVIDAGDECQEESELVSLLLKAAELGNIRIFFTTRNPYKPRARLAPPKVEVVMQEILEESSRADIALYLEANMDQLPKLNQQGQKQLVSRILDKSQGCFLWVNLVFQELRDVHTSAAVEKVLDEVPSDMNDLYARILNSMSPIVHSRRLAKAVLCWTVCAARPLTTEELNEALTLDLQDTIDSVEASIQSSCGQLAYVDAKSVVRMVHLTARDYLLDPHTTSEFAVREEQGHERLLLTCIRCLQEDERPGLRRHRSTNSVAKCHSPFSKYASESLNEHLRHTSWTNQALVSALAKFFESPSVLSWIEYIAAHSDLSRLIDTGKALGDFLNGVPEEQLSGSKNFTMLSSWSNDLVRMALQFGSNLKAYPPSIHNIIPPFCPSATAPRMQFGSVPRGITVRGVQATTWDDCLTTISSNEPYSCMGSSEKHFAFGHFSGKIAVLRYLSYHQVVVLQHGEPVRILKFGHHEDVLASAGSKTICLWNFVANCEIYRFDATQQCMDIVFADQGKFLLAAMKDHRVRTWSLIDGELVGDTNWTEGLEETALKLYRRPIKAAFSEDARLLGVVYKGQDILIWDIESNCLYDLYNRQSGATEFTGRPYGSAGVRCLEFGAGASADLLAAVYTDGELVLFDMNSGEVKIRDIPAFAHMLARSPDGSKLATADPSGKIQIFHFDTLQPLYRINSVEPGIQDLVFSGDSHNLLDIRGSRGRVWGPTVLVQQSGRQLQTLAKPQEVNMVAVPDSTSFTAISCHDNGEVFFCGKENGSVYLFDVETGLPITTLFSHVAGVEIVSLQYHNSSQTVTSVDTSSRILIHKVTTRGKTATVSGILLDFKAELAIGQVIARPDLNRILVCSTESSELRSISPSGGQVLATVSCPERDAYYWANHPLKADQLLLITRTAVHIYEWASLEALTPPEGIPHDVPVPPELSPRQVTSVFNHSQLAVMCTEISRPLSNTKLLLYNSSDLAPETKVLATGPVYKYLSAKAIHLAGSVGTGVNERLVFLQSGNWIGTVNSKNVKDGRVSFHFFFPADWMSTPNHLRTMLEVTKRGDIILVKRDEVAIVRRGLVRTEFEE